MGDLSESEIFQGYDGFRKFGEPVATSDGYTLRTTPCGQKRRLRVIFKGMGMSGIDFAHHMQDNYPDIDLVCYERNVSSPVLYLRATNGESLNMCRTRVAVFGTITSTLVARATFQVWFINSPGT